MEFLQQNAFWVALALVSGAMLLWPLIRGGAGGAAVSPIQATLMINREDAIVVDVREPAEYAAGHVPHSRAMPMGQVAKRLGELDKYRNKPVIVVCQSGNRSSSACNALRRGGFERVYNLSGGIAAWEQAGLPVTKK